MAENFLFCICLQVDSRIIYLSRFGAVAQNMPSLSTMVLCIYSRFVHVYQSASVQHSQRYSSTWNRTTLRLNMLNTTWKRVVWPTPSRLKCDCLPSSFEARS